MRGCAATLLQGEGGDTARWPDLRGVHVAVEMLWLAVVVLFGYPYMVTFYVAAFGDATSSGQTCSSANSCGEFTGWVALANLAPAVLIALGYIIPHPAGSRQNIAARADANRDQGHWHQHLYWSGSVLGLVLIAVQVVFALMGLHLLLSADMVSIGSGENITTVQVARSSASPPRRLQASNVTTNISAVSIIFDFSPSK